MRSDEEFEVRAERLHGVDDEQTMNCEAAVCVERSTPYSCSDLNHLQLDHAPPCDDINVKKLRTNRVFFVDEVCERSTDLGFESQAKRC